MAWVFEQGGWVSYALALMSVMLWTAVALRAMYIWPVRTLELTGRVHGHSILARFMRDAQGLIDQPSRLEHLAQRTMRDLSGLRNLITTLVAVAPLLGLLGTVTGMVEMFSSMQGAANLQGESTVAGGISTALVTTQLGLVISAPGLVVAFWLTRQQIRRERDINQIMRTLQGDAP